MDLNDLTNENYNKYVQSKAKPSPIGKNLVWAFTVGGLICVLGQGMWDGYHALGLDEKTARTAVSITLIFITALLTGIGVFDSFAKHAVPFVRAADPCGPLAPTYQISVQTQYTSP